MAFVGSKEIKDALKYVLEEAAVPSLTVAVVREPQITAFFVAETGRVKYLHRPGIFQW